MRRFPQVFAKFVATITFSFGGLTLLFLPTAAQNKFYKEANRSSEAAVTLESVTALTEAAALKEFIGQAAAIGVFPAISQQTALFLEQATGDGVLSVRTSNGWTTPAFYSLGSVRYRGIFIKGGKFAVIVLFIRKDLLLTCGKENVRLEAGKNTRPGVVGTLSDTQQAEFKDAVIIAYSFSKGRLLPLPPQWKDWNEFTLNDNDKLNKRIYGIKTCELMAGKTPVKIWEGIAAFSDSLTRKFGVPSK